MPATNVKTRWVGGDLVFYDKSENEIFRVDGTNRKLTLASGAVLDVDAATSTITLAAGEIGAADLSANLKKGYVPLPLENFREVSSDATINAAGNGGLLASDTTPILQRVNGATDKALRLHWAAANVDEITQSFAYPPDLDDAAAVVVNILAAMAGATDIPVLAVGYFEGVGDTNAGGNTGAVTGTTVAKYTASIAAADIGAYPKQATVSLTPAAHGTDILYIYAAWIEYTRKD